MSPPPLRGEHILTVREAAGLLKVGVQTIKNYIYQGKIKSFKTPGGHHRIRVADLPADVRPEGSGDHSLPAAGGPVLDWPQRYEALRRTALMTVRVLLQALDERDTYAGGHSERVARYALALADRVGVQGEERERLEWAALLHDIGKVQISREILSKPGRLTDQEWSVVRRHPALGDDLLRGVEFLDTARQLIRHHHERFDGTGYPDRLAGSAIPLGARIIAVAETYDSLTSSSSYRDPVSPTVAAEELRRASGSQLDPELVQQFVSALPA